MPALLKSRSSRPNVCCRRAKRLRTDAGSLTSAATAGHAARRRPARATVSLERVRAAAGEGDAVAFVEQGERDGAADARAGTRAVLIGLIRGMICARDADFVGSASTAR